MNFTRIYKKRSNELVVHRRVPSDPSGRVNDIYPTLPSDIGRAVLIGRTVQKFLRGVETIRSNGLLSSLLLAFRKFNHLTRSQLTTHSKMPPRLRVTCTITFTLAVPPVHLREATPLA